MYLTLSNHDSVIKKEGGKHCSFVHNTRYVHNMQTSLND